MRAYLAVSGTLFGLIALLHVVRSFLQLSAQVGSWMIPGWASWLGAVVAGSLCVWAFRLARTSNRP